MKVFGVELDRPPERRTMENPNTPLSDPDDWVWDAFGAEKSSSGVRVTAEKALGYSPVYRATSLLARGVAKLPLFIYARAGKGKERAAEHPAYRLLRRKPNRYMTAFVWKETMLALALNRGNAFSFIDRKGTGEPVELLLLDPEKTTTLRVNGEIWYVTRIGNELRKIAAGDMIHIRGLGDGIEGRSVISYAHECLGGGLAAQQFSAVYFANGVNPSLVIEHPSRLTPDDAAIIRQSWKDIHGGLENKHKVAVLSGGAKINPYSNSPEDAQLIETKKFSLVEIANFYGVPPHKLGDTSRTAYASLEQENQSFLDDSLDPWLVKWEEECGDKLLTEREKEEDSHIVEFLRSALVRANTLDRFNGYASALQNGWMNRDEVRACENLNPMPDGEGEKFFVPKNMDIAGEEPDEPTPPAAPPAPPGVPMPDMDEDEPAAEEDDAQRQAVLAAHRDVILTGAKRIATRIASGATKQAKAADTFIDWIEGLEDRLRAEAVQTLAPMVAAWRSVAGPGPGADHLVAAFLAGARDEMLAAAEVQPAELGRSVAAAGERIGRDLMVRIVDEFMAQEVRNGA